MIASLAGNTIAAVPVPVLVLEREDSDLHMAIVAWKFCLLLLLLLLLLPPACRLGSAASAGGLAWLVDEGDDEDADRRPPLPEFRLP